MCQQRRRQWLVALGVGSVLATACGAPPTESPARDPVSTTSSSVSVARGTVLFSPVCPVERHPPDPACAPRPGPADVKLVRADGGVAGATRAGDDGQFVISAAPGSYRVEATVSGPSIGRGCESDPSQVTVDMGAFTTVSVSCDTGIR